MLSVEELVDRLIDLSFAEDIGDGDHTTLCCIPEDAMGKSHLLIKEDGILAGVEVAKEVFRRFDPDMKVEVLIEDGAKVKKGDIAMIVTDESLCGASEGNPYPNFGHSQDDTGNAYAGEAGCEDRWWRESSHRFVRYDSAERQPHRFRRWYCECH